MGKRRTQEGEEEELERKRREGRDEGRARNSAHPAFAPKHLKESLVLMVLEEGGGNVLLSCCSSSAPRPGSHRTPTHGAFCPCSLLLDSGCRVRRGTSAVSKGTGSAKTTRETSPPGAPQWAWSPPPLDRLGPSSI